MIEPMPIRSPRRNQDAIREERLEVLRMLEAGAITADDAPRPRQAQAQAREERRQILEDLREKRITADEAARRLATLSERAA